MTTKTATWDDQETSSTGMLAAMMRAVDGFQRARSRRRTQMMLADLDDHVLDDIGINPGDVRRAHRNMTDWFVQTHSGTARLVFIGR